MEKFLEEVLNAKEGYNLFQKLLQSGPKYLIDFMSEANGHTETVYYFPAGMNDIECTNPHCHNQAYFLHDTIQHDRTRVLRCFCDSCATRDMHDAVLRKGE